jgi:CubicO group peptidase (beta-lactamase class C family)
MRRREFLRDSAIGAVGLSLAPLATGLLRGQSAARPDEVATKSLIAALEEETSALMTKARVRGASIALIGDGRLLWRRGFGVKDIRSKEPVDEFTVFQAASTSKPVFAYAVMKLCERGVMNLDTPLTRYSPERFLEGDARLDLITARHVLSHTSGLPNWRSKEHPLAIQFAPGEKWAYSGEGYSYLQSVVTYLNGGRVKTKECDRFEAGIQVCAREPSIDQYMQKNVLGPFGMTSSGYAWTKAMEGNIAWGYDPKGQPLRSSRSPSGPAVARYGMAGGLCTTPTDYAKFLIELVSPKPADTFRLTRASLDEMLRPHVKWSAGKSWGLGWDISHTGDGEFISHGGGNPGYSCFVAASVERKSGYVIMTNSEEVGFYEVIAKLISGDTLARLFGGKLQT